MSINDKVSISIQNMIWMVGVIFTAGISYSHISHLETNLEQVEEKLDKEVKIIKDNKKEIIELQIALAKLEK